MLPELHAERQLARIEAAAVPHLTDRVREETIGKYQRILGQDQRPRRATLEDLQAIGFAVTTVPKKVKRDVR